MNDFATRPWKAALSITAIFNVTTLEPPNSYALSTDGRLYDRAACNSVLLVHGFHDSAASMEPMRCWLTAHGWNAFAINLSPSDGSATLEDLAKQLAIYVDKTFPDDQRVDLVGFSMGGLVCRYYVQRLSGARRVDRLITISAPNHGTWLACLSKKPGCLEMRPKSAFLTSLNRDADSLMRVRFTSIWTPLDLMIVPASSSHMPVGSEQRFCAPAHPLMILQVGCFRKIKHCLSVTEY
jgi:triacylglycerol lipase